MSNTKAQIKMMETISVLLVFLILLTFVVLFYINMSVSSQSGGNSDRANLQAIQIAQLISYMPEFQCSSRNIIIENCFDMLKMDAFINYTSGAGEEVLNTVYFDQFAFSHIVVQPIYPPNSARWELYSRQPNRARYDNRTVFIPVSLYNATANTYTFGILNVTVHT